MTGRRPKILFVVAEDWYFYSHRLPIARAAQQAGYDVAVATHVAEHGEKIAAEGIRVIPWGLRRESYSPLQEFAALRQLRRIYAAERPDLAHHVALKPILYGSIAARRHKRTQVINAWAGLGFLVASASLKARLLRTVLTRAFRILLNRPGSTVLVQNSDDGRLVEKEFRVPRERIELIRGSGVDLERFAPAPEPAGTAMVLLAARMIWIKGVEEFVAAAQALKAKGVAARFVVAGDSDEGSPTAIPRAQLQAWHASGAIEWAGWQADITDLMRQATIVCLPSHGGEGIPKVLLEAAACGRALVTTDVPGCREVVRAGENGLLVPSRDVPALAGAIEQLLQQPAERRRMGARSREIAAEFAQPTVVGATLKLYRRLCPADDDDKTVSQASAPRA